MASTGNGWPVVDVRRDKTPDGRPRVTIYLRIPAELASECDGCSCTYCKAHPTEIPRWDTLAVCDDRFDHSWTVHMPDPRPVTPIERTHNQAQLRAEGRIR